MRLTFYITLTRKENGMEKRDKLEFSFYQAVVEGISNSFYERHIMSIIKMLES